MSNQATTTTKIEKIFNQNVIIQSIQSIILSKRTNWLSQYSHQSRCYFVLCFLMNKKSPSATLSLINNVNRSIIDKQEEEEEDHFEDDKHNSNSQIANWIFSTEKIEQNSCFSSYDNQTKKIKLIKVLFFLFFLCFHQANFFLFFPFFIKVDSSKWTCREINCLEHHYHR